MLLKYEQLLQDQTALGELATFVPNKKQPIYNWAYYKEGFSRDLVLKLINDFGLHHESMALDPFCGVGTALVGCREKGITSIGMDVMPFPLFASHVRTSDYDTKQLRVLSQELFREKFQKLRFDVPVLLRRAFSKYALEDIAFFMQDINRLEGEERNFFLLALISASMKVSYAWKDGAVIKIRKTHKPPLRFMYKKIVQRMIKDLEKSRHDAPCTVLQCDARKMHLEDGLADAIITSPPYLNNIDYTKIYEIENHFITGIYEKPALRSHIGLDAQINFLPELLPPSAMAYFSDMNEVLKEMHRVLVQDGKAAIVVGNAYIDGRIIDSDLILAKLAEDSGFIVESIDVLNKRFALENRTEQKGILRESMIIMRK